MHIVIGKLYESYGKLQKSIEAHERFSRLSYVTTSPETYMIMMKAHEDLTEIGKTIKRVESYTGCTCSKFHKYTNCLNKENFIEEISIRSTPISYTIYKCQTCGGYLVKRSLWYHVSKIFRKNK